MRMINKDQVDIFPLVVAHGNKMVLKENFYKLYKTPKAGWKDRVIFNPESVGESIDEVCALADYFPEVPELSRMLKVHALAKCDKTVGDIRTDIFCPANKRWTKEKKFEAEKLAMEKICKKIKPYDQYIFGLWLEYKLGETKRAKIAKQIVRFQTIRKAAQYQLEGKNIDIKEFINNPGIEIKEPILKRMLNEALDRLG